jgi:hypothetical protein
MSFLLSLLWIDLGQLRATAARAFAQHALFSAREGVKEPPLNVAKMYWIHYVYVVYVYVHMLLRGTSNGCRIYDRNDCLLIGLLTASDHPHPHVSMLDC